MRELVVVTLAACLSACLGEAAVSYQGSVSEGDASSYHFSTATDRAIGVPIVGATVQLIVQDRAGPSAMTDASGSYGPLEQIFGGFAGVTDTIGVVVTALDGRTFSYDAVYGDTSDPTNANPSCDPSDPCPPNFLDFTLAAPSISSANR